MSSIAASSSLKSSTSLTSPPVTVDTLRRRVEPSLCVFGTASDISLLPFEGNVVSLCDQQQKQSRSRPILLEIKKLFKVKKSKSGVKRL